MVTNFVEDGKLPTFVALAFRNGMRYRYLNVRVNSANDASRPISCKNFMNFGPVTPELTELICERLVRHGVLNMIEQFVCVGHACCHYHYSLLYQNLHKY